MPILTAAWWAAKLVLLRGNAAAWLASNAVNAAGIGAAALAAILVSVWAWHTLFAPAPVHRQTAAELAVDVAKEQGKVLGAVLDRAADSERASAFARDANAARDYDGSANAQAVIAAQAEKPGGPLRVLDDRTLELLRKP